MIIKPLIILGSARKESDTRKLVNIIFSDVDHTLIDLLDTTISGYDYMHQYADEDSHPQLVEELLKHELIVFATPVYWYSMSSLMKTLFDRFSDLVTYKKIVGRQLKGKSVSLIAVGADELLPEGFETPFRCTAEYLEMKYLGSIYQSTKNISNDQARIAAFRKKLGL